MLSFDNEFVFKDIRISLCRMGNVIEQRTCNKFCFQNDISATKALETLQKDFKDYFISKARVFVWYKKFKDGTKSFTDDPNSGRQYTSINDQKIDKSDNWCLKIVV